MSNLRVYLAGPINDCTDEECKDWRERVKRELPDVDFLDPMRRDYRNLESMETAAEIVENDKADINNCEALLVYHDRPSVGTSMEILYAFERGIYVLTVGCTGKPLSPWILYHSSVIVNTLDEAIERLKDMLSKDQSYELISWDDGL